MKSGVTLISPRAKMFIVRCSACGQKYALPEQSAGVTKKCRKCHATIEVPRRKYDLAVRAQPKKTRANNSRPFTPRSTYGWPSPVQRIGHHVLWMSTGATLIALVMISLQHFGRNQPGEEKLHPGENPVSLDRSQRSGAASNAARQMYDRSVSAVVFVNTFKNGIESGHGSGFFLDDKIVTNFHVVDDADYVVIETYWRQNFRVDRCLTVDRVRDLAILPVPDSINPKSLELTPTTFAVPTARPAFRISLLDRTRAIFGASLANDFSIGLARRVPTASHQSVPPLPGGVRAY